MDASRHAAYWTDSAAAGDAPIGLSQEHRVTALVVSLLGRTLIKYFCLEVSS